MISTRHVTRRHFIQYSGLLSTATALSPMVVVASTSPKPSESPTGTSVAKWQAMMKDPVREMISGKPDLNRIMGLFPKQTGKPAIDPQLVRAKMQEIETNPKINTGYEFLDLSILTGLAHIDLTFVGDHPKYGVVEYSKVEHDGFPPTIIAAVDALTAWGMNERAATLFSYWLTRFVKDDGTIDYYGPSLTEYGQLLHTGYILYQRAGGRGWWSDGSPKLNSLAEHLLGLHAEALAGNGLISGVPEADTRYEAGIYFHNNAWVARGLQRWVELCDLAHVTPSTPKATIRSSAERLSEDTLEAINKTWPTDRSDWWLPARLGHIPRPKNLTDGSEASYTNYRYWLELLSSGVLPNDMANRIVEARLGGGGSFCGITRFRDWLDDWPLADYLYGLWDLGRRDDFLLSLFGHISYHQCEGHLTAYEQFRFPGDPKGSWRADYCLPSQLVAARAGRLINKK